MNLQALISGIIPKKRLLGMLHAVLQKETGMKLTTFQMVYNGASVFLRVRGEDGTPHEIALKDGRKLAAMVPALIEKNTDEKLPGTIDLIILTFGEISTVDYYLTMTDGAKQKLTKPL